MLKEICTALIESDVNIRLVQQLRKSIRSTVNFKDLPPAVNKKRIQRLYRQEGLSLRGRRRKKRYAGLRVVLPGPDAANQRWSMDFMTDALADGRRFRLLNVVDD